MTFNALIRAWAQRIDARPYANGLREVRLLVEHVTGHSTAAQIVVGEHPVPASDQETIEALIVRREAGEPLQRLMGRASFWDFEVGINAATLVPRDDTETLVRAALDLLPNLSQAHLVDVGTGSGIVLFAIARERQGITGLGVDIEPAALEQAQANAEALGLEDRLSFAPSNWLDSVDGPIDMIVSNPPYVRPDADLTEEVRDHDPSLALFAGPDGLDAYRALLPACASKLAPGGHALFEIGYDQASEVEALGTQAGLSVVDRQQDLGGKDRVVVFQSV